MNEKAMERLIQEYEIRREKSEQFLEMYPKLIKGGFIAIFTIPLIFMILMFSVESKLIFLMLWIASILIIAAYLIGIEYYYFYYKKLHTEFDELMNLSENQEDESEDKLDDDELEGANDIEDDIDFIDLDYDHDTEDEENADEDDMEGVQKGL